MRTISYQFVHFLAIACIFLFSVFYIVDDVKEKEKGSPILTNGSVLPLSVNN